MTLYEFNQQGYDQMPDYNSEDLKRAKKKISKWLKENEAFYYAFICNELKYYTIFKNSQKKLGAEVGPEIILEVASTLGTIKGIDLNDSKTGIEFWIKSTLDNKAHMFLMFKYDKGVIDLCHKERKTH